MPNPISNYAYYTLREAYGLTEEEADDSMKKQENPLSFDEVEVKENTKRYNSMELITNVKNWKYRTMHTAPVGYPYWENVARVQEDTQMKFLIARYALLVFPLLSLLWLIYGLFERKTWTVKGLVLGEIEKRREKRNWEAYEKMLAEKEAEAIIKVEGLETEELNSNYEAEAGNESFDDKKEEFDEIPSSDDEDTVELRSVTGDGLF